MRLVFLGTPAARCRRSGPCTTPVTSRRSWSPTRPSPRPGAGVDPEPRQGRGPGARPARAHARAGREVTDVVPATGVEVGVVVVFGQLLPEPVRRGAAGVRERALLAAAPVAGRAPSSGPSSRATTRPAVRHATRRGPRHRARLREGGDPSATRRPRASWPTAWSTWLATSLSRRCPTSVVEVPDPGGRGDLAKKLTARSSAWTSAPPDELVRVVHAGNPRPGRGRPSTARPEGAEGPCRCRRRKARGVRSATGGPGREGRGCRLAPWPSRVTGRVRRVSTTRLVALDALVRIEEGAYSARDRPHEVFRGVRPRRS